MWVAQIGSFPNHAENLLILVGNQLDLDTFGAPNVITDLLSFMFLNQLGEVHGFNKELYSRPTGGNVRKGNRRRRRWRERRRRALLIRGAFGFCQKGIENSPESCLWKWFHPRKMIVGATELWKKEGQQSQRWVFFVLFILHNGFDQYDINIDISLINS